MRGDLKKYKKEKMWSVKICRDCGVDFKPKNKGMRYCYPCRSKRRKRIGYEPWSKVKARYKRWVDKDIQHRRAIALRSYHRRKKLKS